MSPARRHIRDRPPRVLSGGGDGSPWQRPSNENTNGLIREYFPKGTDFTTVSDHDLLTATDRLNGRPRKVLNYATPAEAFTALLTADGATTA